jgi:hypothetical protein
MKMHVWRIDHDTATEDRPWILSFEGTREAEDFRTFEDAINRTKELIYNPHNPWPIEPLCCSFHFPA